MYPDNCAANSGAAHKPCILEGKKPLPLRSVICVAFAIFPAVKALFSVLNNQPFSKPITAILSKAFFCSTPAIILPVVCSTEAFKFFSSPSKVFNTFGNSSPVTILISSNSIFLTILFKALKGSRPS